MANIRQSVQYPTQVWLKFSIWTVNGKRTLHCFFKCVVHSCWYPSSSDFGLIEPYAFYVVFTWVLFPLSMTCSSVQLLLFCLLLCSSYPKDDRLSLLFILFYSYVPHHASHYCTHYERPVLCNSITRSGRTRWSQINTNLVLHDHLDSIFKVLSSTRFIFVSVSGLLELQQYIRVVKLRGNTYINLAISWSVVDHGNRFTLHQPHELYC